MADNAEQFNQDEIERLLQQAQGGHDPEPPGLLESHEIESLLSAARAPAGPTPTISRSEDPARRNPPRPAPAPAAAPAETGAAPGDVEFLFRQAEAALASVNAPASPETPSPFKPFQLSEFRGAPASTTAATLDLIRDVELNLKIELGRTHMYLEDVLKLRKGSVVPLDKLAGDPVDIYVNGRLIARGEVLVLNDNFAVRVAELIATENPV